LSKEDTAVYVRHRMRVAGAQSDVFNRAALNRLYKKSRGIPRLINVVADRALLAAYTQDNRLVDGRLVEAAAAEVFGPRRLNRRWWPWAAAGAGVLAFGLATTNLWNGRAASEVEPARDAPYRLAPAAAEAPASLANDAGRAQPATVAAAPAPPTAISDAGAAGAGAIGDGGALASIGGGTALGEATASPTLATLIADPDFAASRERTVGELISLWGARYDPARGPACDQAAIQGLRCLEQQNGSLGELRRLNLPAILSLVDDRGERHDLLVASLGHDAADVIANGKKVRLPVAELSYHWYGEHLLLWRPGFADGRDLAPGMIDAGVVWLRETLARIAGEQPPADASNVYDADLERRVREYQVGRMLAVDGIVGARTQIAMIAELDVPGTPLLASGD
jgi:general secretion pathway protein A